MSDIKIIYDTEFYQVELHDDDPDEAWYHIVNKEHGVAETKQSLKPQALVYCEQFNTLLKQETHKKVAENMVRGMLFESFEDMAFSGETH